MLSSRDGNSKLSCHVSSSTRALRMDATLFSGMPCRLHESPGAEDAPKRKSSQYGLSKQKDGRCIFRVVVNFNECRHCTCPLPSSRCKTHSRRPHIPNGRERLKNNAIKRRQTEHPRVVEQHHQTSPQLSCFKLRKRRPPTSANDRAWRQRSRHTSPIRRATDGN